MHYSIELLGKRKKDNWWHYAWVVFINGEYFEYNTGTGHSDMKIIKGKKQVLYKEAVIRKDNGKPETVNVYVRIPELDKVLHALFTDISIAQQSFFDFCDECGYSNDSIKAFDIYRACNDSYQKLRKALGSEYLTEKARIEALDL